MKKKILVVEDNKDTLEFMTFLLRTQGFDTVQAEDGPGAVELATSECPDLILMDIGLPCMDGFEATRIIRAIKHCGAIPIIALTAFRGVKPEAIEAGCTDLLEKPVEWPHLMSMIGTLLTPETI